MINLPYIADRKWAQYSMNSSAVIKQDCNA